MNKIFGVVCTIIFVVFLLIGLPLGQTVGAEAKELIKAEATVIPTSTVNPYHFKIISVCDDWAGWFLSKNFPDKPARSVLLQSCTAAFEGELTNGWPYERAFIIGQTATKYSGYELSSYGSAIANGLAKLIKFQ